MKKEAMHDDKTFYITTAIAYANAAPHMGYAYEVVCADIIARYHRLRGERVFFLTGTDEHGEKIIRSAKKAGTVPQAFVDANVEKFISLTKKLQISYSDFIRTSDKHKHWPGAQALWAKLLSSGDIYKGVYKGLYCVGCEAFITEKDLVDGKCPNHNAAPEMIEEENYFFRLSKYTDRIRRILESGELEVIPDRRKQEMLALLDEGLQDISISRPEGDVLWGVPVPNERGQMMYVWFEALINYISALGYGKKVHKNFDIFWPADVHVVGKDIVRFHAIIWPAMLLSARLPLPRRILVHGFITSGGKKMSKSLGNVIDPLAFIDKYGAEPLRYYLAREVSPFEDSDFTEERFLEVYNAHLANGLGNLVSRVTTMAKKYFGGTVTRALINDVPTRKGYMVAGRPEDVEGFSISYIITSYIRPRYEEQMNTFAIHHAMDTIWEMVSILDHYITDYEPFKLISTDKEKTENIIWSAVLGLYEIARMLAPHMPSTADAITSLITVVERDNDEVPTAFAVTPPASPLFARK